MIQHEKYMRRCIELAKLGEGRVAPNPLVGSVVLDSDGNVAGEGFHEKYGEAHAEINALNTAGDRAKGGTLYINLEPCFHYGQTPPCVDRVIESGIKQLVLGMTDPNPKVEGKSILKVRDAGIEVIEDVLNRECVKLNEIFVKNVTENKPFVAIKTASTMDGKIATYSGKSKWITSEVAREEVHRLRNRYDAIITGSNTVMTDNPALTCRIPQGRNPVRVVVDTRLITSKRSRVYENDGTKVMIATAEGIPENRRARYPENIGIIEIPLLADKLDLKPLVNVLYKNGIYSIMIESGAKLNTVFLKNEMADKIYFFLAPKLFGDKNALSSFEGLDTENPDQCVKFNYGEIKQFSPDIMIEGYLDGKF